MTKEELIEFLKENLKIQVEVNQDSYSTYSEIKVSLFLDSEVITEGSTYVVLGK